jgi:hypothetical protein
VTFRPSVGGTGGAEASGRGGGAVARRHARDDLADGHRVARLREDLLDRPRRRGRDLGVDLVGGDLDDRLVLLDRLAGLLGPLEDRALGDRLAHCRHHDVDGRAARLLRGRLGGRRRRGAIAGRDLGEHGADGDRVPLGGVDLGHGAGRRRRDLGVDLVGGDLDEYLVFGDLVALLFMPLQDGALGNRVTHLWHGHFHRGVDRHRWR